MNSKFLLLILALGSIASASAERILHLPMEASKAGRLTETTGNKFLQIYGHHTTENVAGAVGNALRFDGYSTYAQGNVKSPGKVDKMTFSMWVAPETYPVVKMDTPTEDKIRLAGTYDEASKNGWSFNLGYTGKYSFKFYSGSWAAEVMAEDLLPCYEWSHLVAVFDGAAKKLTLYRNGKEVGSGKTMDTLDLDSELLSVGKVPGGLSGSFATDTFNGVIDEIEVFDEALAPESFADVKPENPADLTIPSSRFEGDLLRPKFHGMPGANWTNETHGMTYSNGRYHVFFQKNANGPYMTRLHWGHISSENLYDWREERIAIAPGESYDVKGCWSGCVFSDDEITGGQPNAIYTGVDYQKAMISQAVPADEDLIVWDKVEGNPIINGRPTGLSDDFRDPYFFRNGDDAYIIVGTSKNNVGAATLHKYDRVSGKWSNDGKMFFQGTSKAQDGRFWEMPTVTKMADGRWLVTVTPLETSTGVHTLYWTGEINADGTFSPDEASTSPRDFELISKDGYGLLSPTIYQKDGKTITLGIVPDKVATSENCKWGWAHLYSFPREISLDAEGNLLQKPFDGLQELRSNKKFSLDGKTISGIVDIEEINGRQLELLGKFKVGSSSFGFSFFKNGSGKATVSYNPATNEIRADFSGLNRLQNDNNVYNGVYTKALPERIPAGSEMTLDVFVDGSIVDIFVNNKWATSIRVYPSDKDADGVEVFSTGGDTEISEVSGWVLESGNPASVGSIWSDDNTFPRGSVNVYTLSGQKVKEGISEVDAMEGLDPGIYLIGGKKVLVK